MGACTVAVWFPTGKILHVWGLQPAAGLLLWTVLAAAVFLAVISAVSGR